MKQVRRTRDPDQSRYACYQVWNKQRKDEVLIDVDDVARPYHQAPVSEAGKWLWAKKIVHPPIIDRDDFDQVQVLIAARAHASPRTADIARVLGEADPDDKSEIFRQLGLRLTYQPGRRIVEASMIHAQYGFSDSEVFTFGADLGKRGVAGGLATG